MKFSLLAIIALIFLSLSSCSTSGWLTKQERAPSGGALEYTVDLQSVPKQPQALLPQKKRTAFTHQIKESRAGRLLAGARKFNKAVRNSVFRSIEPRNNAASTSTAAGNVMKIAVIVLVLFLLLLLIGGTLGRLINLLISILLVVLLVYLILWLLGMY